MEEIYCTCGHLRGAHINPDDGDDCPCRAFQAYPFDKNICGCDKFEADEDQRGWYEIFRGDNPNRYFM